TRRVFGGGHPHEAEEAPSHRLLGTEPTPDGDPLDGRSTLQEALTCRLDAEQLDGPRRCDPDRRDVVTAEAPLTHAGPAREGREREVFGKVLGHPRVKRVEWLRRRLKRERRAELSLPAGTLQKYDEVACDAEGSGSAG